MDLAPLIASVCAGRRCAGGPGPAIAGSNVDGEEVEVLSAIGGMGDDVCNVATNKTKQKRK